MSICHDLIKSHLRPFTLILSKLIQHYFTRDWNSRILQNTNCGLTQSIVRDHYLILVVEGKGFWLQNTNCSDWWYQWLVIIQLCLLNTAAAAAAATRNDQESNKGTDENHSTPVKPRQECRIECKSLANPQFVLS